MNLPEQLKGLMRLHEARQLAAARHAQRVQRALLENAQRIAERRSNIEARRARRARLWTGLPESMDRAAMFRLTQLDAQWRLEEIDQEASLDVLEDERAQWLEEQRRVSDALRCAVRKQDNAQHVMRRALATRHRRCLAAEENEIEDYGHANRN